MVWPPGEGLPPVDLATLSLSNNPRWKRYHLKL